MICSSVNRLFFTSVILLVDGLLYLHGGTARGEQVILSIALLQGSHSFANANDSWRWWRIDRR